MGEQRALAIVAIHWVIVIVAAVVVLVGCLHRDPGWPGYLPPDSTRCAPPGERCS